jgi:acetyl esterase/lipase
MKTFALRFFCAVLSLASVAAAQDVIPLYPGGAPGSPQASYPEKRYFSKAWNTEVVTNVTQPTLTVFKPAPDVRNGTAVVICPGGGFMALSIESEGAQAARYLANLGVTAFVLKYRVAHTGEDGTQEFGPLFADRPKFDEMLKTVLPLAVADGLAAVAYVRQHAAEFGVAPDRVGIMGFSAGGTVTDEVALGGRGGEGRCACAAGCAAVVHRRRDR